MKMALECMALLSYGYRSRQKVFRKKYDAGLHDLDGCTRRATLMLRDTKLPVCWQHARQTSLHGPPVPLDEEAARQYGSAITWRKPK